ncbi:MAG: alpha/beta fold hydrolase [Bacteroidota bacterium]
MIEIGGVKQAVMVRGTNPDNPVLVYLHGGPGFPIFPIDQTKHHMESLEERYTIVYWEQRGTGKSFRPTIPTSSMKIDQFVEDTKQIIEYAQKELGVEKVFLWGHSWGTNIGALFASKYPEYLHAYISTGQSVNPFKNERLGYEYVHYNATKTGNKRALRQLETIDTIPERYSLEDALLVRKWINKFGGIVQEIDKEKPYVELNEIYMILSAVEYSVIDRIYLLLYPYYSAEKLWDDLKRFDLMKVAPQIDVPVYFLIGSNDIIVSNVLAEQYFNKLSAPAGKELIWFEKSAHRPFFEEPEKFLNIMKNKIPNEVLHTDSITAF